MKLQPLSFLNLKNGEQLIRLSYVFEDDGGCRKGLTVSQLLPNDSLAPLASKEAARARPAIYSGATRIGTLDPRSNSSDRKLDVTEEIKALQVLCGSALTRTFSILDEVEVDAFTSRNPQVAGASYMNADAAHVVGEGAVGVMGETVVNIRWNGRTVYPLLQLRRSAADLQCQNPRKRQGAMVSTSRGALIGVIVAISQDRCSYVVSPIHEIMEVHRLNFLRGQVVVHDQTVAERRPAPAVGPQLPLGLDARLQQLLEPAAA